MTFVADDPEKRLSDTDSGTVVFNWPPEGVYADLWTRLDSAFTDGEKLILRLLITKWVSEDSTLVAVRDETGEWTDVEPDWAKVQDWCKDR